MKFIQHILEKSFEISVITPSTIVKQFGISSLIYYENISLSHFILLFYFIF